MKVGYNGAVIDAGEAVISIYDHGFLYGIGLFETFRTYGGAPYLLDRHLRRLYDGCRRLGIRFAMEETAVRTWLAEVMAANGLNEAYVRLTVSAGDEGLGLPAGEYEHPHSFILVKPLQLPDETAYRSGRELRRLRTVRNTPEGEMRFKSLHYMNNIIAKRELLTQTGAAPGTEGLMMTREGRLAEGITSNIFMLLDGKVCTPAIATGILPGITRERVLELAQAAGYETEEGWYDWNDLRRASEVWTTGSVQELMPISALIDADGARYKVGTGEAGPAALELLRLYRQDTTNR